MDNVSDHTKNMQAMKNEFRLKFYQNHQTIFETIKENLGFNEDERKLKAANQMSQWGNKYQLVNHFLSQHTLSL
jgi:hypothetical protein